jgi:hypothetical protein
MRVTDKSRGSERIMHLPAGLGASLPKGEEKLLPILLIQENKLTPITAAHQVIASSCILNAQWSSIDHETIKSKRQCQ